MEEDMRALCDMVPMDDLNGVVTGSFSEDQLYDHGSVGLFDFQEKPASLPSVSTSHPRRHGKGKELKVLRRELLKSSKKSSSCIDSANNNNNGLLTAKLDNTKRKLKEGYQKYNEARKKTCLIDIRALPPQPICRTGFDNHKRRRQHAGFVLPPEKMIH